MLGIGSAGQHRQLLSWLLGFLLLYTLAVFHLREKCSRDPSSLFWRPTASRRLSYSTHRQAQALTLAHEAAQHALPKWNPASPPRLCVAIGSVSRHGSPYLKQTLGSLLAGLAEHERQQIYVVVFLAHRNQSAHEDSGAIWLRNMVDSLPAYPDDPELLRVVAEIEDDGGYPAHARKQKIDYAVLLDECTKVGPAYMMTLEDDVIALDGWFHRTFKALRVAEKKTREMGRAQFLYLRIFTDGRLLGWNSEEWPRYLTLSTLLDLCLFAILLALRARLPTSVIRKSTSTLSIFLICGLCTPLTIGLFFASGRHCLFPTPPGVRLMPKYGCCGQALVFPQQRVVEDLLPLYRDTQDAHAAVDTFLEDYADANGELRWALAPGLVQHVGVKSSHGVGEQFDGDITGDMPFDFGFEMNEPVELAREQKAWVDSLSGDM